MAYNKKYYDANKEKMLRQQKAYYKRNRKKIIARVIEARAAKKMQYVFV